MKTVMEILKNGSAITVILLMILSSNHFFTPRTVVFIDNSILLVVYLICLFRIIRMIEKI